MSKLNLGLEALSTDNNELCPEFSVEDIIEMSNEEFTIQAELMDLKKDLEAFDNFIAVCDSLKNHGGYAGFESLISDYKELVDIIGVDIRTASIEELSCIYSNENIADSLSKFGAKISAALGRVGDRLGNFIKTTLPFKEKYLKEMTELKQILSGKKFDEERLAEKKVASAMTKEHYNKFVQSHKGLLDALHKAAAESSSANIETMLRKMEEHPEVVRGWFNTYVEIPWKSWFTKGTVKDLGYTGKDVLPVVDAAIAAIKNIEELRTTYAKMVEQFDRLETQISQDRAVGKVEEAIEKRKAISNLQHFFYQMCEAAGVYDITTRRLMYFATYLGRAAKDCMQ